VSQQQAATTGGAEEQPRARKLATAAASSAAAAIAARQQAPVIIGHKNSLRAEFTWSDGGGDREFSVAWTQSEALVAEKGVRGFPCL
jgi:hypothetical protein